jgi:dienelactone hydrolase
MRPMQYEQVEVFPGIASVEEWRNMRERIRRDAIDHLLGPFPATRCDLSSRTLGAEKCDGYRRVHVEYMSEPEDAVRAYLLIPDDLRAPAPAVIAVHTSAAAGKDSVVGVTGLKPTDPPDRNYAYALDAVQRGYVTLAPDMDTVGERAPDGHPWDTRPFYARCPDWSAMGKATWDLSRAVDYLVTLEFVDASRIACAGHCFGAYYSVFAGAFDERVAAVLANAGIWTFTTGTQDWAREHDRQELLDFARFHHGEKAGVYCHTPKLAEYLEYGKPGAVKPLPADYWQIVCLVAPRPMIITTCSQDLAGPTCQHLGSIPLGLETEAKQFSALRKVYGLNGAEANFATWVFEGEHTFGPEARRCAFDFLDGHFRR